MGRKKGSPAYRNKTQATSFITTPTAFKKLKAAERRSRKSRSDCVTDCIMAHADNITREHFDSMAQQAEAR